MAQEDPFQPDRIIPERLWYELNTSKPFTKALHDQARRSDREQLGRIAAGGGYVSEGADGVLVQAIRGAGDGTPDERWWAQGSIQQALLDLQVRQRRLIEEALRGGQINVARASRGEFLVGAGIAPEDRARFESWAEATAFSADLANIAREVTDRRGREERASGASQARKSSPPIAGPERVPDGLGGWRETPPPVFTGTAPPVRLAAFDRTTGRPSEHLLRLLKLAGEHPRAIRQQEP